MTEKFTPGEWEVKSINTHRETAGTIYSTQVIAPSAGYIISSIDTKDEKLLKMIQANAHLIAAAPEMYRVLQGICFEKSARICEYAPESCKVCAISKALKKVRGEE